MRYSLNIFHFSLERVLRIIHLNNSTQQFSKTTYLHAMDTKVHNFLLIKGYHSGMLQSNEHFAVAEVVRKETPKVKSRHPSKSVSINHLNCGITPLESIVIAIGTCTWLSCTKGVNSCSTNYYALLRILRNELLNIYSAIYRSYNINHEYIWAVMSILIAHLSMPFLRIGHRSFKIWFNCYRVMTWVV